MSFSEGFDSAVEKIELNMINISTHTTVDTFTRLF